ncbi:MAG: SufD family Fe-S cluster assembly protein [Alistipes sp.]|nr:SufD family Fe-S cluster assembly protein [Alistipes sp.]
MELRELIRDWKQVKEQWTVSGCEEQPVVSLSPEHLTVEVAEGGAAHLVILCHEPRTSELKLHLAEGASLTVNLLFTAEAFLSLEADQEAHSSLKMTSVELGSANARLTINLRGRDAESEVNGVFLTGGEEHAELMIRTNHLAADCRSRSIARGVAGGKSVGRFEGMVYVAQDAQRTDAEQQNRNLLLSQKARIETMPQLEIYADDVKCSHGATVGQMDQEAVYYMRQRGMDEQQARRLQIVGFVGDLVMHCNEDALCDAVLKLMEQKLETM